MGYGIGMFLAGLVSGATIGWYVTLIKVRIAYGNPEGLNARADVIHGAFV